MKNEVKKATKEGYIIDYVSQLEVKATPEEVNATQPFSRVLVNDYNYPINTVHTRPQFFVKKSPSDKKGSFPIDIGIFKTSNKKEDELYIVVECKKPTEKDGIRQLKDYMTLSTAEFGVWYNGIDSPVYLRKIFTAKGGIEFERVLNIPKFGEKFEDIGLYKRKDLITPHNLKTIFNSLRNHLAGNAVGTTRDEELAKQLINIVFTKIYDERFTAPDTAVTFRAGIKDSEEEVYERITDLFRSVKEKYKEVIDENDKISLDKSSLYYIVGQLQSYCLIDAERDAIADAFEIFIGNALKGAQGQFFTPRNVVKLMIEILNQSPDEKIIDPACGSGGFIVESLRSIWRKMDLIYSELNWGETAINEERMKVAMSKIYGIEKDSLLAKVAKAYMAILGDGKGGIYCEDSLELPKHWSKITQQNVVLNGFDCLLANPPFGKEIKVKGAEKLSQFDLARKWTYDKGTDTFIKGTSIKPEMPPQILFIERCLELLTDGGRMGIIIPETYFHAPKSQFVMSFMAKHNIYCILDLPHNTFRPHNNAKCIAIFLEKNVEQQDKILMCVAEEMGHDHQGKEIYRWDHATHQSGDDIWDDTQVIKEEIDKLKSQIKSNSQINWVKQADEEELSTEDLKYTFWVNAETVTKQKIYVPRYYWNKKTEVLFEEAEANNLQLKPLSELITEGVIEFFDGHGSPESENKGRGEIPYIRVKDIVNWEVYKDPTSKIPEIAYEKIFTEKKKLEQGDILYVRRGSYRIGSVAMVSPFDIKVLLTREILVIRIKSDNSYGITPYYMLYLLSHWLTQEQAKNKVLIETTLPNIGERWKELAVPIHNDKEKMVEISNTIKQAMDSKWSATSQINELIEEIGELTT